SSTVRFSSPMIREICAPETSSRTPASVESSTRRRMVVESYPATAARSTGSMPVAATIRLAIFVDPAQQRAEETHERPGRYGNNACGPLRVGDGPGLRSHLSNDQVQEGDRHQGQCERSDVGDPGCQADVDEKRCHRVV